MKYDQIVPLDMVTEDLVRQFNDTCVALGLVYTAPQSGPS
jgi:hypothetical protein